MDAAPRVSPFPSDGEWTTHPSWAEVISLLSDPAFARSALDALGGVFPSSWVRRLISAERHPLELDYWQRAARLDLIELGLALAALRPRRARERLRNPLETAPHARSCRRGSCCV